MLGQIRKRGFPAECHWEGDVAGYIDSVRKKLERQRGLMRRAWFWYFGSLVPAVVYIVAGSAGVYPKFALLYILLTAELIQRTDEMLRREIEGLDARQVPGWSGCFVKA
jgi:hypothetical protein